ncbi:MAG: hypothetical protein HY898_20540 [Deltaproteobacteria bacterium]|nr:hypothetical protein [Deltaproteobacteria bacterium]
MRLIEKGPPPRELEAYRLRPNARYDGDNSFGQVKERIRKALVREQGWLCCYCMQRIEPLAHRMNVEHWASQRRHEERALDWTNLLGACKGEPQATQAAQHCDLRKGDSEIQLDPQKRVHIDTLSFTADGELISSDAVLQADITERLNLNAVNLRNLRRTAVQAAQRALERKYSGPLPRSALSRELEACECKGKQLPPFSGAIAWWLRKRLSRA